MSLINVDFPNGPNHPSAGHNGMQQAAGQKTDAYSLDLFDLVKRKFWIIQFFVLLGIGLSLLYYFKAPKTYESIATIFVDEKSAPMAGDSDGFSNESSIEKYLVTLKSTKILKPAIASGNFHDLDTFADCDDILYFLREEDALSAKPADAKSTSGVIKLSFQGSSPEECQAVLDEIVATFDEHILSTTKNIGGETAKLVTDIKDQMLTQLEEVDAEIRELMVRPELLNIDGRVVNPHQMQLGLLHQELHDVRSERRKILARVENVKKDLALGKMPEDLVVEIMSESVDKSTGAYATVQSQFVELKIKEQELLNQFGPDHPDVRSIRNKIETVDQMRLQELAAMRGSKRQNDGEASTQNLVADFLNQMQRKVAMLNSEEKSLDESIQAEQQESTSVSALVENLNSLQRKRERLENGSAAIIERLGEINALKEHLWRNLAVLDPPSLGEKVAPSLPISLAAGFFLGSLLGLLFAGFKDIAEKTFRSSDDVGKMLNTRVIGHVSMFQKLRAKQRNSQFPNVQAEVVTMHAPAAQSSESYRAIRTSIFFKAQETGAKVIQVTSPTPGDGKSTTISNLAASIAQSGRRVLLIDADMRKPVQHKLFGVTNDFGLTSAISGEMDPEEVIQPIQAEYLSIVTAGPIPNNPAELLTSARFAAIIEEYRSQFDFVLIDTPPMLAVTDPSIVCGHVDLVYLVMRIRNGVRTSALRAKEIIDSMGIELGGVVINGLRRRDQKTYEYSGQYGYGTNQYGRGNKAAASVPAARTARKKRPSSRV
ncbi:MAG: polysaccharide biosynthesis tyrosine autokinase [Mariniblastus sp.]